jgi:3,4-dihydroxy 2-butanone 4-phosphate synthase/GTP cyclohydrolase II
MARVHRIAEAALPTRYGDFRALVYRSTEGKDHVALIVVGDGDETPVLVRLHSECLTGDVLGSRRCDCGEQLQESMRLLHLEGRGVLLYLRQEGRGVGLANKIRAYALQDRGYDTVEANHALGLPADARDYGDAAAILHDLGVARVRLLTNNPAKVTGLAGHGIQVVERLPIYARPNAHNAGYLATKQRKMGHLFPTPARSSDRGGGGAAWD